MKTARIALAVAALALLPAVRPATNPAGQQFQQALELLQIKNDPAAAAPVFEKLSRDPDRQLAARALLYLGECREKLGNERARAAYERLIQEFPDRADLQTQARHRLAALTPAAKARSSGLVIRRVWANAPDNSGTPSPDGRLLTFIDWETGDLAVRDLRTGENRRLTHKGSWTDSPEYAEWPKMSADGKQVAYSWSTEDYGHQLRLVPTDAGEKTEPRIVVQIPDLHYIIPWAWSPDSKSVLALFSRGDDTNQLVWITMADGTIRPLKSLEWRWPVNVSLSPDGRFLVYDLPQTEGAPERDLFIMPADGSRESVLLRHESDDYAPVWTPDGKAVVFASTRTGSVGLWSVPVANGQTTGPAELVKADLGQISPLGFTRDGKLYYAEHRGMDNVFSAELDPSTGQVRGAPVRLIDKFVGRNSAPAWSPDGRSLAYFSNRDPARAYGIGTLDIIVRSMETGAERVFSGTKLNLRPAVRWMPDGRSLLIAARDPDTRQRAVFHLLNVTTGQLRTITRSNLTLPFPVASPDGRSFLVAGGDQSSNLGHLLSYDVASGEARQIYQAPPGWVLRNLAISPDGSTLAFSVANPDVRSNFIYTLPVTGGEPREVVRLGEGIAREGLAWTQDGRYLLFVKTPGPEQAEMFRVSTEGGLPQPTGLSGRGLSLLSVHPDGKRLAYTLGQYFEVDVWALENFLPVAQAARAK